MTCSRVTFALCCVILCHAGSVCISVNDVNYCNTMTWPSRLERRYGHPKLFHGTSQYTLVMRYHRSMLYYLYMCVSIITLVPKGNPLRAKPLKAKLLKPKPLSLSVALPFILCRLKVPEKALGGIPLGFGIGVQLLKLHVWLFFFLAIKDFKAHYARIWMECIDKSVQ